MLNLLILLFLLAVSYYLSTYARWTWRQGYRRGAVGTFLIALLTLVLPIAVWAYHQFVR
ncbi:MAG: hypothetical protein AB1523_04250 [Bacillota bacterium]